MKVSLKEQVQNAALPLNCVRVFTGSALPLIVRDVPDVLCGARVAGVKVRVTNADGAPIEAPCERGAPSQWFVLLAAKNFMRYGFVSNGVRVALTLEADGETHETVLGVGDFEVIAANADAAPGVAGASYVTKGGDLYVRSETRDGVQHYVKQTMEFVTGMGWGANWTGDYILTADGEFVAAN